MKRNGFTLIDLMVIIFITANVAAVLYPVFSTSSENARKTTCQSNLKQIGIAVQMYVNDWHAYPCNTVLGGWFGMELPLGTGNMFGYVTPSWITNSFEPNCARGVLTPYNNNGGIWACPTDIAKPVNAYHVCTDYSKIVNDFPNGHYYRATSYIYRRALWIRYDTGVPGAIPAGFFAYPARLVAFYELYPWHHYVHIAKYVGKNDPFDTSPGSEWADVDPSSNLNCLFLDGHVAVESWGQVFTPPGYPPDFGHTDVSGGTWSTQAFKDLYDVN
jgi:prepilin-type processing-associated H-X9-DG protein